MVCDPAPHREGGGAMACITLTRGHIPLRPAGLGLTGWTVA